ncbi:MAG: hypothetical protein AAFQ91_11650 [Cyanobacteria bacterium J06621_15]
MKNKPIITILTALVFAYILSYGFIRLNTNRITHRTGTSGCNYANHWVEAGDTSPLSYAFNVKLAMIFTPLRFLEVQYWNLIQPPGSTLMEEDKNLYSSCKNQV